MKKIITASILGIGSTLSFTTTAFAQLDPRFPTPTGSEFVGINIPTPAGFRITSLGRLISSTFALLLIVAGLLAFVYLVLGGIRWITSGGDKTGLEAARNMIIHAIIGLIVVFSAWAITLLVQQFLGITILGNLSIPTAYQP